jgi:hypothetical protein
MLSKLLEEGDRGGGGGTQLNATSGAASKPPADGEVVGRIYKANAAPVGSPWMWTLDFWHHEDRAPTHGYVPLLAGHPVGVATPS